MKTIIKILLLIFAVHTAGAQLQIADKDKYAASKTRFENRLTGKHFPLSRLFADIPDYRNFILNKKAKMIFIGFDGCIPCKYQLPFFLEYAKDKEEVCFLYLTYDAPEKIKEELVRLNTNVDEHKNVVFLSVNKETINESHLSDFGYPAIFFLNMEDTIMNVDANGDLRMNAAEYKSQWTDKLFFIQ